jgi:DNA-binding protein H-NS
MMADSYEQLLMKKAHLEQEIERARTENLDVVIEKIRDLMSKYDIRIEDIDPNVARKGVVKRRKKAPPKYRNPDTGETWSGRGVAPRWLVGKDRGVFLIPASCGANLAST